MDIDAEKRLRIAVQCKQNGWADIQAALDEVASMRALTLDVLRILVLTIRSQMLPPDVELVRVASVVNLCALAGLDEALELLPADEGG